MRWKSNAEEGKKWYERQKNKQFKGVMGFRSLNGRLAVSRKLFM
jgi:hypothetical protein